MISSSLALVRNSLLTALAVGGLCLAAGCAVDAQPDGTSSSQDEAMSQCGYGGCGDDNGGGGGSSGCEYAGVPNPGACSSVAIGSPTNIGWVWFINCPNGTGPGAVPTFHYPGGSSTGGKGGGTSRPHQVVGYTSGYHDGCIAGNPPGDYQMIFYQVSQ